MHKTPKAAYVVGQDRNDDTVVAHLYRGTFDKPGKPMCARGWNRSDGHAYSIFRNNAGSSGVCKICSRRAKAGLAPIDPRDRKTKWL